MTWLNQIESTNFVAVSKSIYILIKGGPDSKKVDLRLTTVDLVITTNTIFTKQMQSCLQSKKLSSTFTCKDYRGWEDIKVISIKWRVQTISKNIKKLTVSIIFVKIVLMKGVRSVYSSTEANSTFMDKQLPKTSPRWFRSQDWLRYRSTG